MVKLSTLFKKIKKNIKLMRLYGAKPMLGAYMEIFSVKLFGCNNRFIHNRHNKIIKTILPCFNYVKDHLIADEQFNPILRDCNIWFMWWQGAENYPEVVKLSLESIKKHCGNHKVIELSKDNIFSFIDIPEDIQTKFANNQISITHYSDIIRFSLLSKYGGIWIDSTMLLTNSFPDDFYKHELYTIKRNQVNNPYISNGRWTTYFFACGPDNIFPQYCRDFLIHYWRCNRKLIDYTILDYVIHIGNEYIPAIHTMLASIDYNNIHTAHLCELLSKPFDRDKYEELLNDTYLFKLSWKETYAKSIEGHETFFGNICREVK